MDGLRRVSEERLTKRKDEKGYENTRKLGLKILWGRKMSKLKYQSLTKLIAIRENNYVRKSTPYGLFDKEEVDREIRMKENKSRAILKKYTKIMEGRKNEGK